jgi:hypothetical protein
MLFNSSPFSSSKAKINQHTTDNVIREEISETNCGSIPNHRRITSSSYSVTSRINSSKSYVLFNKINSILSANRNRKRNNNRKLVPEYNNNSTTNNNENNRNNGLSKINLNAQSNVINLIRLSSATSFKNNNNLQISKNVNMNEKVEQEQLKNKKEIIDFDSIKKKNLKNKDQNDQKCINNNFSTINNFDFNNFVLNNKSNNKKTNEQLDLASFISLDNYCHKAYNNKKNRKNRNKVKNYLYYYYYRKILETKHNNNRNLKKNGLLLLLLDDGYDDCGGYNDDDAKYNNRKFKLLKNNNNNKLIRNLKKDEKFEEESNKLLAKTKITKPFASVNGNYDYSSYNGGNNHLNENNNVNDISKTKNKLEQNLKSIINKNNNYSSTINSNNNNIFCLNENNILNNQQEILVYENNKNKHKNNNNNIILIDEGEKIYNLNERKSETLTTTNFLCNKNNENAYSASSSLESIELIYQDDDRDDKDFEEEEVAENNNLTTFDNNKLDLNTLNNTLNNIISKENKTHLANLLSKRRNEKMIRLKVNSNNKQTSVLNNVTDYLIIKNKLKNVNNISHSEIELGSSSNQATSNYNYLNKKNTTNQNNKNEEETIEIINKITNNNEEIKKIFIENAKAAKISSNNNQIKYNSNNNNISSDFLKVGGQRMDGLTPNLRKKLISNQENQNNTTMLKTPDMNMINLFANKTRLNSELAFIRKCVHQSFEKLDKINSHTNILNDDIINDDNREAGLVDAVLQYDHETKTLTNQKENSNYCDIVDDIQKKSIILENFILTKLAEETAVAINNNKSNNYNCISAAAIDDDDYDEDEVKPSGSIASNQNKTYLNTNNCNNNINYTNSHINNNFINNTNNNNQKKLYFNCANKNKNNNNHKNTNRFLNKNLGFDFNNTKVKNFLLDDSTNTITSVASGSSSNTTKVSSNNDISAKLIKSIHNNLKNSTQTYNNKLKQTDAKILNRLNPNSTIMYVNFLNNLTTNINEVISTTTNNSNNNAVNSYTNTNFINKSTYNTAASNLAKHFSCNNSFNKSSSTTEINNLVIKNSTNTSKTSNSNNNNTNLNISRCSSSSINETMNKNKELSQDGGTVATTNSSDLKIPKISPDNNKRAINNKNMKINQFNRSIKIKCFDSFNEMPVSKPTNGSTSTSPFKKISSNPTNNGTLHASLLANRMNKASELLNRNRYSRTPDLLHRQSINIIEEYELTKAKCIYLNTASSTSHLINQNNSILIELNNKKDAHLNNLNLDYKRVDSIMSEYDLIHEKRMSKCNTPTSARQNTKFNNNNLHFNHQTLRQIEFMQKELQVRKLKKETLNQLKNNLNNTTNQSSFQFNTSVIAHLNNINSNNDNFNVYKFYERSQLN